MFRLRVLEACGPYPSDPVRAADLRYFRARKAAWHAYLFTAYACGMFEGNKGKDLLGRLRSMEDDDFRAAMAECMACWFLAGRMKLPVDACAPGRDGKNLEMRVLVDGKWTGVEVKAPFREKPKPPPGRSAVAWFGDDADKIEQSMEAANKQFADDRPNLLVIVPILRKPLFSSRHDVVKAAYGQSRITWAVDTRADEAVHTRADEAAGPIEVKFFPEGKFLNPNLPNGKAIKPDGFPAYQRIGALLCLEEKLMEKYPFPDPFELLDEERRGAVWPGWERARQLYWSRRNEEWVEHDALVLHNPHAYHPLSPEPWSLFPQLVPVEGEMRWTDGYRGHV
jgi:hypothetical protein